MERDFALKITQKKLSTESFLTFRELQPLIPYKRVSYIKKYVQYEQE